MSLNLPGATAPARMPAADHALATGVSFEFLAFDFRKTGITARGCFASFLFFLSWCFR
jgi:hypothetical protein